MAVFLGGRRKPQKYTESSGDNSSNSVEALTQKLSADVRKHIRTIQSHPFLSQQWINSVETLHHISNIAMMEQRLPAKAGGTLWERDQLTVRFVLEESKLNLCIRALMDFKEQCRDTNIDLRLERVSRELSVERQQLLARMKNFEESVGLILGCCFKSVETLQTSDLGVLVKHCTDVLAHSQAAKVLESLTVENASKAQETLVVQYLESLASKLEDLREDHVIGLIAQHQTVAQVVDLLYERNHLPQLSEEVKELGCQFLSYVFSSEMYATHRGHVIGGRDN
eukprot:CAMPEP_0196570970 /NCGR_PEP_ID=MMETSP1081-20130531/1140_1 /TAXON_ID=36882 /ORGANISM="Pyramimonas amylifera, Strain CCMP720" /LENGTH=281 /DNA_ID=CAMNT_0041887691 /DNA_START=61 /DNA_END=905 /DNA_ORIENTATION=+